MSMSEDTSPESSAGKCPFHEGGAKPAKKAVSPPTVTGGQSNCAWTCLINIPTVPIPG
jgi:hypothetical protein